MIGKLVWHYQEATELEHESWHATIDKYKIRIYKINESLYTWCTTRNGDWGKVNEVPDFDDARNNSIHEVRSWSID
jgi:hypothetical protein